MLGMCPTWKNPPLTPEPIKTTTKRGPTTPANIWELALEMNMVQEKKKKLRICWNPEGKIFLAAYVPPT